MSENMQDDVEPGWEKVEAAMPRAKAIAYDGCHKIYLAMDEQQAREFEVMGYGSQPGTVFERVEDPAVAMERVHDWFDSSCGLEFVEAVKGDGTNDDFESLIPQFAFARDDD